VQLDKLPQPSPPHLSEFSDKLSEFSQLVWQNQAATFFAEPYSNGARTVFSHKVNIERKVTLRPY